MLKKELDALFQYAGKKGAYMPAGLAGLVFFKENAVYATNGFGCIEVAYPGCPNLGYSDNLFHGLDKAHLDYTDIPKSIQAFEEHCNDGVYNHIKHMQPDYFSRFFNMPVSFPICGYDGRKLADICRVFAAFDAPFSFEMDMGYKGKGKYPNMVYAGQGRDGAILRAVLMPLIRK